MKLLMKVHSERTRKRANRRITDTTSVAAIETPAKRINQSRNNTTASITQKLTTTSKLLILLIGLVIIVAGVLAYYEIKRHSAEPARGPILFGNNYEHGTSS